MAGSPDEGWAWVILAAVTIINLAVQPIQQNFGLVFGELFSRLGITATQVSLILHLNSAIMCSIGLVNGPMMRRFSFRTVAFVGSFVIVSGIFLTAFSKSLAAIIVTYCIFIGIGQGCLYPAIGLAVNTYFREKRKMAMGLTITLTGLGPILMPQLIAKSLDFYATTGTIILLAGIAMHSYIGAILLKPLEQNEALDVKKKPLSSRSEEPCHDSGDRIIQKEDQRGMNHESSREFISNSPTEEETDKVKINVDMEAQAEEKEEFLGKPKYSLRSDVKRVLSRVATSLDLHLLSDNRYLVIMLGMGVSFVSELNFNLMMPIILKEMAQMNYVDLANVMSIQAFADIAGRLCVPLLAQKVGWSSRSLYVVSLLGSTTGRIILAGWSNSYAVVVGLSLLFGAAKGTKAVFQSLVVPDSVPLSRLPAASGLLMVCSGILSITLGPLIGLVRDMTESYIFALHFTSALSLACAFLWLFEALWAPGRPSMREEAETSGS